SLRPASGLRASAGRAEEVPEVRRIAVVFEHLLHLNGACATRVEDVDRANFQSSPSDSSSAINFRIRAVAAPFIAALLSRSHFTTSFPSPKRGHGAGNGRLST